MQNFLGLAAVMHRERERDPMSWRTPTISDAGQKERVETKGKERGIGGMACLFHGVLGCGHELGGEAELAVGAEDGEGGDVAVAVGGFFLHLGEDVADDAAVVVFGDVEELGPGEDVIEVVLHLVVLREAEQVARLHRQKVLHRRLPYAHHLSLLPFLSSHD